MSKLPPTIEEQITNAMITETSSAEVLTLLEKLEASIEQHDRAAAAAHDSAMKLTSDPDESEKVWRSAELKRDRLKGALPRLEARYGALKDAEELGAWRLRYFAVKSDCTALAKEFHERIPKLFGEIVDLFERMGEVDRSINQINSTAPDGAHERLLSTELTARNRQGLGGSKSIVATTQLPDLSDPNKLLWPPPKPNVAAAMSFVPAFDKKYSPRWWEANEEIDQRRRQLQEQRIKQEEEEKVAAQQDYHARVAGWTKQ